MAGFIDLFPYGLDALPDFSVNSACYLLHFLPDIFCRFDGRSILSFPDRPVALIPRPRPKELASPHLWLAPLPF